MDYFIPLNLLEIVDIEVVQRIQDCFSKATKFGAVISDVKGQPITQYSMFSPICQTIRNHPEGKQRCQKSDEALGYPSLDRNALEFHYCHAGLVDMAAPIIVNNTYLGTILCGQVLCDSFDEGESRRRFERCIEELNLDKEQMEGYYRNIPVHSLERINEIADLLRVISNQIVEMGINRINQAMINEVKLSVMEEHNARLELEQSLKQSELKSLESTVNPHFLFNTLNSLARLAMIENAPRTEEMAYTMAELLRYNLRNVGSCMPFREEVEFCNKYIQLQKIRFADRFEIRMNITEEAMDYMMPAMTLHPLIENALIHGLKNCISGGLININAEVKDGVFILQVSDNGDGISPEILSNIRKMLDDKGVTDQMGVMMGLSNVCRQLHHFFHSNCAMDVMSEAGAGTTVIITAYESMDTEEGR